MSSTSRPARSGAAPSEAQSRRLASIAERVLELAAEGETLEVAVAHSGTTRVRAFGGDVEALTVADVAAIGVRIVSDGRLGFASAGSLDDDVVDEVVAEARDNLAFAEPDPHVTLVEPDGVAPVALDLWDQDLADLGTEAKVSMALELEAAVLAADPRITGVRSAAYGDSIGVSVLASTTGIFATVEATMASLGLLALARDGDDTKTGSGSSVARGPAGLDPARVVEDAAYRATALLGAVQPLSGRVTLVLEPRMAAPFLGIIGSMLSGERVLKGRTPFADRVGEQIAAVPVNLIDDPTDPASFGARRFDGEGLAARRNPLVSAGVLDRFLHNSVSASRSGTASTASATRGVRSTPGVGWHALRLEGGEGSLDELVAGVETGLLVHSMAGLHSGVNAVSGDFSAGAEGIMIRDGALAEPVREVTIASALPKMLRDVAAIGDDVEHLPGGVSTPSIAVANVSMGGK